MNEDVLKDLKARIDKTLDDLKKELGKIRTGRANPSMVDGILVNYYGTPTPLTGMASLTVPEPPLIVIKPWEKSALKDTEKAIKEANIGVTPMNDGEIIRLPLPALTEDRRKEIAKQVKGKGEEHKVAIRNVRRDANERLKVLLKDKKMTEDDNKRLSERVQKETDAGVTKVEEVIAAKEKEVMQVGRCAGGGPIPPSRWRASCARRSSPPGSRSPPPARST